MPVAIKMMHMTWAGDIASLNRNTLKMLVPTMPMPVQMAYAVPSGRFFKASAKNIMLKTKPMMVMAVGPVFEKPSEAFMAVAHVTSDAPARRRNTHSVQCTAFPWLAAGTPGKRVRMASRMPI